MEFRGLKEQYETNKELFDLAITHVLKRQDFIEGKEVKQLEEELAEYVKVKHCVTCANGTDALFLVLWASKITKGDAVFVPDFTFFATAEAPALLGATPILVDVDVRTYNLEPDALIKTIDRVKADGKLKPKAIISVDLFGLPAQYERIEEIARKNDLLLFEDGAQGFGGSIYDRKALSFGKAAITSFFPSKPLGGYGDGGAVFTNDDELVEQIRRLKAHGRGRDKYDNIIIGMNSRLNTLQAAVLRKKLEVFEAEQQKIQVIANEYNQRLQEVVRIPYIPEGYVSSYAQYTIGCRNHSIREKVKKRLLEKEIPANIYYPIPLHEQIAIKKIYGHLTGNVNRYQDTYPVSNWLSNTVLSLPMHAYLTLNDISYICNTILEVHTMLR